MKHMLKEYWKGCYVFEDGRLFDSNESLVVAMHPFFRRHRQIGREPREEPSDYVRRVNNFLANRNGDVIVFEDEGHSGVPSFDRTAEHLWYLGKRNNVYFVKTGFDNPYPIEISLDESIDYTLKLDSEGKMALIGGELGSSYRRSEFTGCLGFLAGKLVARNVHINFLENMVF